MQPPLSPPSSPLSRSSNPDQKRFPRELCDEAIRLNRTVAVSFAATPEHGLRLLDPLAAGLETYAPFHLARADMRLRTGGAGRAREDDRTALEPTRNQVERTFILGRIAALGGI
jgi:RNA polymerase sigma-70 factor (ECF subfamily)